MSLSNSERNNKIIWSVNRLTILASQLEENENDYFDDGGFNVISNPFIKLKNNINKLWSVLLSSKGNAGFWLLGSDENVEADNNSLWSIALYNNIKNCSKPIQNKDSIIEEEYIYDCQKEQFQIEDLLSPRNKVVYEIYKWLQNINYATNRYKDSLSEEYKEVNSLVSTCVGIIFNIFYIEKQFTVVWLKHEIAKILIGKTWKVKVTEADSIQLFINKHAEHHTIKSYRHPQYEIKDLKNILSSLTQDNSLRNRCKVLIHIVGSKVGKYAYQAKDLKILAESFNIEWKVVKVKKQTINEYKADRLFYREDLLDIKN